MNQLKNSNSPYLKQHADNPVNWYEWGNEALSKAKNENKPILLSIGYSSCHWCHVMAHESFEDEAVASIMNEKFVNIKLDREERPDIDQIYMDAIQAMGLNGGWPLNVFLTPDQKPFYGGTYFPKDNWIGLLNSVSEAFIQNKDQILNSAEKFTQNLNIKLSEKYKIDKGNSLLMRHLQLGVETLSTRFDYKWGGIKKAPKFPMPSIWKFLLLYSKHNKEDHLLDFTTFTLDKIESGGIYDQIGGGFARYSVDGEWHVPHFEKMLYDNGQLISLYSLGYQFTGKERYKEVVLESIEWLEREMKSEQGGYYSALDADSEGVEGKYYVWSEAEIDLLAGDKSSIVKYYYNVLKDGNWEHTNVLRRLESDQQVADKFEISIDELKELIKDFISKALAKREERIAPGLDDKVLTCWNALLLTGFCDAYMAFEDQNILEKASSLFKFLATNLVKGDKVLHQLNSPGYGFADDYSTLIQSFISYYQISNESDSLKLAMSLTDQMIENFWDEEEELFFYTSKESESLIARKKELFDNVIPASNSLMAENLIRLGLLTYEDKYSDKGTRMTNNLSFLLEKETEYLSQWSIAGLFSVIDVPEIAIIGDEAEKTKLELNKATNSINVISATDSPIEFPGLCKGKTAIDNKTTIYICRNKSCLAPVHSTEEALKQL